jgi:hypothetical protein
MEGEHLLAAYEALLWGRPRTPSPNPSDRRFGRTERDAGESTAKSVFQIAWLSAVLRP